MFVLQNYFQSFPAFTDDDKLLICVTRSLLGVYDEVQHAYEHYKLQTGQLDFDDLQIKMRDLLQQESIHEQLAQRYLISWWMSTKIRISYSMKFLDLLAVIKENTRAQKPSESKLDNLFIVWRSETEHLRVSWADVRVFDQTRKDIADYQLDLAEDFAWTQLKLEASDQRSAANSICPKISVFCDISLALSIRFLNRS